MPEPTPVALAVGRALDEAVRLRSQLEDAIGALYEERQLIGALDAAGVMLSVQRRQVAQTRLVRSQSALLTAIAEARVTADATGTSLEPGLGGLLPLAPVEVAKVRSVVEEISTLATRLRAEEGVQAELITRAKRCIQGYLGAITPKTMAYDARGAARSRHTPRSQAGHRHQVVV